MCISYKKCSVKNDHRTQRSWKLWTERTELEWNQEPFGCKAPVQTSHAPERNFDLHALFWEALCWTCSKWLRPFCPCSWSFICLMTIPQVQWTRRQERSYRGELLHANILPSRRSNDLRVASNGTFLLIKQTPALTMMQFNGERRLRI